MFSNSRAFADHSFRAFQAIAQTGASCSVTQLIHQWAVTTNVYMITAILGSQRRARANAGKLTDGTGRCSCKAIFATFHYRLAGLVLKWTERSLDASPDRGCCRSEIAFITRFALNCAHFKISSWYAIQIPLKVHIASRRRSMLYQDAIWAAKGIFGREWVNKTNLCTSSVLALPKLPSKGVKKECVNTTVKRVSFQECPARVSTKSVKKECLAKSVQQECQERVSNKSV